MNWIIILFLFLNYYQVWGAFEKAQVIEKSNDWHFVGKFCYDTSGPGTLNFTTWYDPNDHDRLLLLFYDDEPSSWPHVYKNRKNLSCLEKVKLAKGNRTLVNGEKFINSEIFHDYVRPHYWYFVVANCNNNVKKLNFKFEFHMVQYQTGWNHEFSFDEQGLPGMYLFYWLFFTVLFLFELISIWGMIRNQIFHPIIRLFFSSLVFETAANFSFFIHYIVYKGNGVGAPGMKGLGEVLDMAAQLCLMFLLILIAKGWCISKNQIDNKKLLISIISLLLLCYVIVFIWENVGRNPASTLYIYESVPGIILLVLRLITWLFFLFSLRQTQLEEDIFEKKRFYLIFGGLYSLYFLSLPLIVLCALALDPWVRYKIVIGLYLTVNALTWTSLVLLFWPRWSYKIFSNVGSKSDTLLGPSSSNSPYDTL